MLTLRNITEKNSAQQSFIANFPSKSRYAEAYRTLRTNTAFSLMDKDVECLLITSSLQGEGKTTTSLNLGFTMAQMGKKVLLVDADLRRPGLTRRLESKKNIGVSNLLGDTLRQPLREGTLVTYSLHDIITLNRLQKRTCIMQLTNENSAFEFFFMKGELVDVYWKNRPEEKRLGSILVREKILSEDEMELALGHQLKSVRRLGSILLNLGMVQEQELKKILSLQTMESVRSALAADNGHFSIKATTEESIFSGESDSPHFSQIVREMSPQEENSFIKKSISESILETDENNLFVLPAGTIPPNPSELLGSSMSGFVVQELKKSFDVVIIDSSPIIPATDALLISSLTDGVILVVEAGKTNRKIVMDATEQLRKAKANILGVVLNQADLSKDSYYKYYESYYGE